MKVILLQDVARLGRKHEVKEVPDGHAQNYLIPRRLAEPATHTNLKRLEERSAHVEAEHAAARAEFDRAVAALAATPLTITAEANDRGSLFKGLRAADVAAAMREQTGVAITPAAVLLDRPIKETGEHTVTLTSGDVLEQVTVTVNPESA